MPPAVNSVNSTHSQSCSDNQHILSDTCRTNFDSTLSLCDVLSSTSASLSTTTVITLRLHHQPSRQQYLHLSPPTIIMALQQSLLLPLLLCIGVVCSLKVPSSGSSFSSSSVTTGSTTAASVSIVSTERQHLSQVKALVVHLINSQTAAAAPSTVGVSSSAAAVTASVKGTSLHNNLNSLPTSITGTLLNSAPASVNSSVSSSSLSAISSLCTDHQTFWDRSVGACVKCSSACPANAYVERQCNRTHDLECTCHKGWYMSVVDRTCKPCAQCPNGWGKSHWLGVCCHFGSSSSTPGACHCAASVFPLQSPHSLLCQKK